MEAKERGKIISACYKIPENEVDVGTVHVENIGAWMKARKAVDVAIFKAGAQNVVKWIEKEYGYFIDDGLAKIIIDDNGYYGRPDSIAKYQAQKKKWGIE